MKKFSYFIIIISVVFVLLPSIYPILAANTPRLEVTYPSLPGIGSLNTLPTITLALYIQYVFIFAFMAAGIIGVISLVIGGIQYFASSVSPEQKNNAKDRILNTILGIILLMLSFILLRTINSSLITPQNNALPIQTGLYVRGTVTASDQYPDGRIYAFVPYKNTPDVSAFLLFAFPSDVAISNLELFYNCPGGGQNILLWVYNMPEYFIDPSQNGSPNVNTYSWRCGANNSLPLDGSIGIIESFFWDYENAGVYYYMTKDCSGISSWYGDGTPGQTTDGFIPWFNPNQKEEIDQGIYSLNIVNNPSSNFKYGVVLDETEIGVGECSLPILSPLLETSPNSVCISSSTTDWPKTLDNRQFDPSYAHIIKQDKNPTDSRSDRAGVTFLSPNYFVLLSQNPNPDFPVSRTIGDIWIDNFEGCGNTNTCNLDNLIRSDRRIFQGRNIEDVPPDECCTSDLSGPGCDIAGPDSTLYEHLFEYIPDNYPLLNYLEADIDGVSFIIPNPDYKGYRSCINTVTTSSLYTIIFYTKNYREDDLNLANQVIDRGCIIFDQDIRFSATDENTLWLFDRYQEIYRTVVIPTVP